MKCLMISTYPPTKCGVATYALQSIKRTRGEGHIVDVLSPDLQGDVDFRSNLKGGFRPLRILRQALFYDRVTIQYTRPLYFDPKLESGKITNVTSTLLAFIILFVVCRRIELVVHEVVYYSREELGFFDRILNRLRWRLVPRLIMHTQKEKEDFLKHYSNPNIVLRAHHEDFSKFKDIPKEQAREHLGISNTRIVFLAIGFIQPSKGFDRLIRAFDRASPKGACCYIVGSLHYDTPEERAHLELLEEMAADNKDIFIRNEFISDEDFDSYIASCDYLALPYRQIWSSGVVARARLFGKNVIASNAGGLADQLEAEDYIFDTDEELEEIIREITAVDSSRPEN